MPPVASNYITAIVDEYGCLILPPEYIQHKVWRNVHEGQVARHTRRHE